MERKGSAVLGILILGVVIIAVVFIATHWHANFASSSNLPEVALDTSGTSEVNGQNAQPAQPPVQSEMSAPAYLSNSEIIRRIKPGVVMIRTANSAGSGFIISNSGLIVTNAHVVPGTSSVSVKLSDDSVHAGTVVGRDDQVDLALVQINAAGLHKLNLGDSDAIHQGDTVYMMGYSLGLDQDVSFRKGFMSRRLFYQGVPYLEVGAAIYPGDSGSPLIDSWGNIIGVNTKVVAVDSKGIANEESIKLAIPSNIVKLYLSKLLAQIKSPRAAPAGIASSTNP